jgi:flavin reductase (DIM6/NTAB) family NADH-FMN oxidoreductase RutF
MTKPEPGAPPPIPSTPAIDPREFRTALGAFGTGVTVITACAPDGRRAALTVNSFASVSLAPPLVLWSLGLHSSSLSIFQDASHFAVNVLSEMQEDLARHFARSQPDKFAGIPWREGLGGAPLLDGTLAEFECRNAYRYYGGDHIIFLGAVEAFSSRPGAPLMFCRGAFGAFAAKG